MLAIDMCIEVGSNCFYIETSGMARGYNLNNSWQRRWRANILNWMGQKSWRDFVVDSMTLSHQTEVVNRHNILTSVESYTMHVCKQCTLTRDVSETQNDAERLHVLCDSFRWRHAWRRQHVGHACARAHVYMNTIRHRGCRFWTRLSADSTHSQNSMPYLRMNTINMPCSHDSLIVLNPLRKGSSLTRTAVSTIVHVRRHIRYREHFVLVPRIVEHSVQYEQCESQIRRMLR